ncbi:MAG: hypothetical protein GY719_36890, partial [bacterium]|nr:hypothetical protein [bacterium]
MPSYPTLLDRSSSGGSRRASTSGEAELDAQALRSKLLDALAASMACQAAVKMHHPMSIDKMERLVTELFRAEQPY